METAIVVIPRPSLLLSLFRLVTSQVNCMYAMSKGLAIIRLKRHRFLPTCGQFDGCLHAPKIQKRDRIIPVPSHRKFDILELFVCS